MCSFKGSQKLYHHSSVRSRPSKLIQPGPLLSSLYTVMPMLFKSTIYFQRLIRLTGSRDEELREASAGVMSNIRTLALTTEKIRFYQMMKK